jgi:hypothetical protein
MGPLSRRGVPSFRAVLLALVLVLVPRAARAVDAFEIQVYDGTANPAGVAGLEVHINGVPSGLTSSEPPEAAPNHQVHLTFEPSYGVTPFWELGGYVQTAWRPGGGYELAGGKLRSKVVTPPTWSRRTRLGVNAEVSRVPATYEASRWGIEIRPIFAFDFGRFSFATNPIVGLSPTEGTTSFEPATMLLFVIPGVASLGLEHYADFGSFGGFASANQQVHYLFEVVNLLAVPGFELNAGVGEGLTSASNALVVKAILGYTFTR